MRVSNEVRSSGRTVMRVATNKYRRLAPYQLAAPSLTSQPWFAQITFQHSATTGRAGTQQ